MRSFCSVENLNFVLVDLHILECDVLGLRVENFCINSRSRRLVDVLERDVHRLVQAECRRNRCVYSDIVECDVLRAESRNSAVCFDVHIIESHVLDIEVCSSSYADSTFCTVAVDVAEV